MCDDDGKCIQGCGFYGTKERKGMCSTCYSMIIQGKPIIKRGQETINLVQTINFDQKVCETVYGNKPMYIDDRGRLISIYADNQHFFERGFIPKPLNLEQFLQQNENFLRYSLDSKDYIKIDAMKSEISPIINFLKQRNVILGFFFRMNREERIKQDWYWLPASKMRDFKFDRLKLYLVSLYERPLICQVCGDIYEKDQKDSVCRFHSGMIIKV